MLKFTKMHGIGNDFIIIDKNLPKNYNKHELARRLCNRNLGIGADGLLLLSPSKEADVNLEILNSDGSEANMCGNGVRCVAKYILDNHTQRPKQILIKTKTGLKTVDYTYNDHFTGTVDIGQPSFSTNQMGLITDQSVIYDYPLKTSQGTFNVTCVYIGNVHTIIFVDNLYLLPFEEIAMSIQKHHMFFQSTNVEFVEVVNNSKIKMRVFERGCGETLGCGTGASAAVYTCIRRHFTSNSVSVELKGGTLHVFFNTSNNHIYLTGTAETVYFGEIEI